MSFQHCLLIILVLMLCLAGCQAPQKQSDVLNSNIASREDKVEDAFKNSISNKEIFYQESNNGLLLKKQIFGNGHLLYESLYREGKVTKNHFYPKIIDAFLFEDKYYLKMRFPLPFQGKISFTLPENPDYESTKLGPNYYQLVINDALDLDQVKLRIKYQPAERDSLIREEYTFTHVVFE
ncbi:MAG: hypothetical protein WD398_01165 [Cyclobacteriaceae bacterium]